MNINKKIKKLLEDEIGFQDDYYFNIIDEIIIKLKSLNKDSKHRILYQLTYDDDIRVDFVNNIIEQIKKDLLENRHNYLWGKEEIKDDYEKGICNIIRLLQYRIHCIMD